MSDSEGEDVDIFEKESEGADASQSKQERFINFAQQASRKPTTLRPRILLAGDKGQGQSTHLAPALLHQLERLPVHTLDLPVLHGNSAKSTEEACAQVLYKLKQSRIELTSFHCCLLIMLLLQVFREAKRTAPSIVYLPHISRWWDVATEACRATFLSLIGDVEPSAPTLLIATSETPVYLLNDQVLNYLSPPSFISCFFYCVAYSSFKKSSVPTQRFSICRTQRKHNADVSSKICCSFKRSRHLRVERKQVSKRDNCFLLYKTFFLCVSHHMFSSAHA